MVNVDTNLQWRRRLGKLMVAFKGNGTKVWERIAAIDDVAIKEIHDGAVGVDYPSLKQEKVSHVPSKLTRQHET